MFENLPNRLEKHKTYDILLMTDFFMNFEKIDNFANFPKFFANHQLHILKSLHLFYFMLICLLKHHETL